MLLPNPRPTREEITLKALRCTVKAATRRGLCRISEQEDLVQDAYVHVLKHESEFDPQRASWPTFCSMLTRGFLYRRWKKVHTHPKFESLNEVKFTEQGKPYEPMAGLQEKDMWGYAGRRHRSGNAWSELDSDLGFALSRLPDELRRLCELFLELETLSAVAKQLEVSCKTVYRRRDEIRELLKDSLLDEYR